MNLDFVRARVDEIAKEAAEKEGLEFVRTEIAGTKRSPVVRVFIDREGGLSVEHCADVSRQIDARLEIEDLIPTKYVLEVSSPGLERELFSVADFRRFTGKLVKVKTSGAGGSNTVVGRIKEADDENITLAIRGKEDQTIALSSIIKANLKIDMEEEFRKR